MSPTRIGCPKCNRFTIHITGHTFTDSTRHSDYYETLHLHCDHCHHNFDLSIG